MSERPSILLIHAHDLGTWLGCYGDASVRTPNLDVLAAGGIRFENAFATAPLCSPARGSLFTGLHPHEHGLTGLAHLGISYRAGVTTLPGRLGGAGFRTVLVGLQHEAIDARTLGFERLVGPGYPPRALFVADFAAAWLRDEADGEEPFFLTVGMWEPHRPWRSEDYPSADPATVAVPAWLPDNVHTRADIAAFHGAIEQMDTAVGTILRALADSPAADNTVVVFTTDHGPAFPRAKGSLYDPGLHVALIVRPPTAWRAVPAVDASLVSHIDLFETLLDVAGLPRSGGVGRSFLDIVRSPGKPTDWSREWLFAEKTFHDTYDPIRSVRTTRWKYIRNFEPGPQLVLSRDVAGSETMSGYGDAYLEARPAEELYDLVDDPLELRNLAGDAEHDDVRAALAEALRVWMLETGDELEPEAAVR